MSEDEIFKAFNNAMAFGYNWQWLSGSYAFSLFMAVVAIAEARAGRVDGFWFAAGAALTDWATGHHRLFWMWALLDAPPGSNFNPEVTKWKWALYFDIQVALMGMTMMARPILRKVIGPTWWMVAPMMVAQVMFLVPFLWKLADLGVFG